MSFSAPIRERSNPVLPLAGMVDILFLTLIFFMTVSAFREQESMIDVSLPDTESARVGGYETRIVITIQPDGTIRMADGEYTLEELRMTLRSLALQFPHETVVIRGDRNSKLGLAVKVMDIAYHDAKLKNVFIATVKTPDDLP